MTEYDYLRNTTDEERAKHEAAMGYPSRQTFEKQDIRLMRNAYVPVITEADLKTIKRKRWWEFWKP